MYQPYFLQKRKLWKRFLWGGGTCDICSRGEVFAFIEEMCRYIYSACSGGGEASYSNTHDSTVRTIILQLVISFTTDITTVKFWFYNRLP